VKDVDGEENLMNIAALIKAFDTVMALREVARRVSGGPAAGSPATGARSGDAGLMQSPAGSAGGIGTQIEARLTNVVMAALKEAFDRDHARLELERSQLDEQRRRAEEAMRLELRRQAADRELTRLRMLVAMALVAWIASVAIFVAGLAEASLPARIVTGAGWLCLLGAMAVGFSAQGNVAEEIMNGADAGTAGRRGAMAVWLLVGGLALTAASLLV
jgi:hypothetical protein